MTQAHVDGKFLYPSVEWCKELADRLNEVPAYRDSSEGWTGRLVINTLAEEGRLQKGVAVSLDPTGGTIKDIHLLEDVDASDAEYVLSARFSVWKDVIQGKHDILYGLMTGKIKLRGQVFKLMLQLKTPKIMLEQMRAMPTLFMDEA